MSEKLPMMIAVRGYAVPIHNDEFGEKKSEPSLRKTRKTLPAPADVTVVFDTETGTNHAQHLRIGTYQVRKGMTLKEKGIFYEPDNVKPGELRVLKVYMKERNLVLRTREEFVREVLYRFGYDYGGLNLGFNLPFDLSRLAFSISTSHGRDMRGGFSLELLPEKWRPNVLVKHLNSRASFMRFAAAPGPVDARSMRKRQFKTRAKTGYFQDVKTLAAALLGGSHSLASLAKLLETEHQKMETDKHGASLTSKYLDYAVNDTDVTWDCYVSLLKLYEQHGLKETPPHRIYSEASQGKAYLRQMAVQPWLKSQRDFPAEVLGIIMGTYYGGRSEVRIRREKTRVLYCDFRSMYPSVCTLMGLWQFVIATGINYEDWTAQTIALVKKVKLHNLNCAEIWRNFTVLVEVAPDGDIFPVRAPYGGEGRTIGLNYLSSGMGHWYTLADYIASKLLSGNAPRILRAIRFTPKGPQSGLKPICIGGDSKFRIDPYKDDFYKRVIELRGQVQAAERKARGEGRNQEADMLDSYQQMLKLLANSTSYGIFAELNVQSHDRPREVLCYGMEKTAFSTSTKSVEEPGTHFHPLLATLITGAARLMLAIGERVAADNGLGWAFCDTDSLALARPKDMPDDQFLKRAANVTNWFDALNPYSDTKPLFKIEDVNFRLEKGKPLPGVHEPLYTIAISAKRYVLFNLDIDGKPIIRKALAHGLGHLLEPYGEVDAPSTIPVPSVPLSEIGAKRWHCDLWYQIIMAELEGHPDRVDLSPLPGMNRPAASQYSASTSTLLHWFDVFNEGRPYPDRVKAFNFMLAYQVSKTSLYAAIASGKIGIEFIDDGLPAVVAPYNTNRLRAPKGCFDRRTGRPVPALILTTYLEAIADYHLHSESKFANGDITDRGITERQHIQVVAVEYIGKEANRWEEQFFLGEIPEAQIEYGTTKSGRQALLKLIRRIAEKFGKVALADAACLSRKQLALIVNGAAEARPETIKALTRASMGLETGLQ